MTNTGEIGFSTVGGYDIGMGSSTKECVLHVHTYIGSSSHFKDDGTVANATNNQLGASLISGSIGAVHGAGSVAVAAGTTGLIVFGNGDDKDDVTILSAQVSMAMKDAAGNAAVDEPANIAVSSIAGGTVNFVYSAEDATAGLAGSPIVLICRALIRGY